ncbi:MAG: cohesin domain-containing protein [Patescibacteria group bacterium]|nr:cohesin domain-containing protein [Patescibacteria group bacterium]MCL5431869.1 cohesin domain-containing protein [Patescibacteria group bacterium]
MRKIIFIAVITIIIFITFIKPGKAYAATLSLSPASGTQAVGTTFSVDIILDPGSDSIGGASAIVTYDTAKLQVQGSSITPGTIFGSTTAALTNTVDTSTGTIRYDSGSLGTAYTGGRGTLATITFKAISAGTAQVNFTFNTGTTTGTSIVAAASGPNNLLTSVQNGIYTITSGSTGTSLPATGALEDTLMMLAGGMIFLSAGIFLARKTFVHA